MFSSLASFLKIKKKSKKDCKICRKDSEVSIGKDVLEVLDSRRYAESRSINDYEKSPTIVNERFLKGASDSKAEKRDEPKPATVTTVNHNYRLYPDLKPLSQKNIVNIPFKKFAVVEENIKSIHDIVDEICFLILPNILNASETKSNLKLLKEDISIQVISLQNNLINKKKYDYDFEKEYKEVKNSPTSITKSIYYIKLENFECLKIYCQRMDNKLKSAVDDPKIKKYSNKKPIFQNYSKSFKSYRGNKRDVVNCP